MLYFSYMFQSTYPRLPRTGTLQTLDRVTELEGQVAALQKEAAAAKKEATAALKRAEEAELKEKTAAQQEEALIDPSTPSHSEFSDR